MPTIPSQPGWAEKIADTVVARRSAVIASAFAIAAVCATLLATHLDLDSEILNLLPAHTPSVEALKEFSRDFSQSRELTVAILARSPDEDPEPFAEHFAQTLRTKRWALRVYDRPPHESPDGAKDIPALGAALLLNAPDDTFAEVLAALSPDHLRARANRLKAEWEAGSPRALAQAEFDPLGILSAAIGPAAESLSGGAAQPLTSPDGRMRLLFVLTDQSDEGPAACKAMMQNVHAAREEAIASWSGPHPEVLVTGRTPYVAEMSSGMEHDITWTLAGSILLVGAVFYIHFRRLGPLFLITQILLLACLVAITLGALIFRPLNGITVGLCSILVGLGMDFGVVLYGGYLTRRNEGMSHRDAIAANLRFLGPGVAFGALTTAAGFLVLLASGCAGFAQLGALIAAGILFAAIGTATVMFACLKDRPPPPPHDALSRAMLALVHGLAARRHPVLFTSLAAFALLAFSLALPFGHLRIEANPRSLEPKGSEAGRALRTIQQMMTNSPSDPVLAFVRTPEGLSATDAWARADSAWRPLLSSGELRSAVTPGALVLDPARMAARSEQIRLLAEPARTAWRDATAAAGFAPDAFPAADSLFNALASPPHTRWQTFLPLESPWRFVVDRLFSTRTGQAVAYLSPARKIASRQDADRLRDLLTVPGERVDLTGWSFTIADLIPWAKNRVASLTGWMLAINVALLLILYRKPGPLFLLIGAIGLALSATLATLKVFHVPLNLFNVLAFPLVLGVVVDYGIYVLIAARAPGNRAKNIAEILKPISLSALTSIAGFGSLCLSWNPSLSTLGAVCAIGIAWGLLAAILIVVPVHLREDAR